MLDAYIYAGLRTPFGRHAGALSAIRPDDLLSTVVRRLVSESGFPPEQIEDVVIGCSNQGGEDSRNVARMAGLLSGLPISVGGLTVNRLCGSGLAAIADAARTIHCSEGELFVAGGVESMSRAPFVMAKSETAFARDARVFDSTIGTRFPNAVLAGKYGLDSMPDTADNVARELQIGRHASDRFAAASQSKYAQAKTAGYFAEEITPVTFNGRKGEASVVAEDEHPRAGSTVENLSRLKPLSEGGVVTAGNASGINDGAAALLVGSLKVGELAGKAPLARIRAAAIAGVEPRIMGTGPVPASKKVLERTGLSLRDMDVIEINEAFACQVLGCMKMMELDESDSRVNPNGGAIAVGHPLGASGARLALTAVRELRRREGRFALVSMCIGLGQGIAVVLERFDAGRT